MCVRDIWKIVPYLHHDHGAFDSIVQRVSSFTWPRLYYSVYVKTDSSIASATKRCVVCPFFYCGVGWWLFFFAELSGEIVSFQFWRDIFSWAAEEARIFLLFFLCCIGLELLSILFCRQAPPNARPLPWQKHAILLELLRVFLCALPLFRCWGRLRERKFRTQYIPAVCIRKNSIY